MKKDVFYLEKDCFACGEHNPIGLKMKFDWEEEYYVSRISLRKEYESFGGVVHGGMVGLLLDEVIGRSLTSKGTYAVTAKLEVNFKAPTPVETELVVRSKLVKHEGRKFTILGEIVLPDGTVSAVGEALMIQKREE